MKKTILFIALLATSACGSNPPADAPADATADAPADATADATPEITPANYTAKDGSEYLYAAAISEDDAKAGTAAASVVSFEYLGERDGVYTLKQSNIRATCTNPCEVITYNTGYSKKRVAFNPASIIGSAFTDAFNGHMEITGKKNP